MQRYIISAGDFKKFISAENVEQFYGGELVYIHTSDMEKMISEIKPIIDGPFFSGDKATLKLSYVFDMMVVGILLVELNSEGTTIMLVTHDVKVASKCTRVMYIVDGNIKGEYDLSDRSTQMRERERALNNWLLELGW